MPRRAPGLLAAPAASGCRRARGGPNAHALQRRAPEGGADEGRAQGRRPSDSAFG